jgi:hypothetical protein
VTARIAALRPGQSPPPVKTAILFFMSAPFLLGNPEQTLHKIHRKIKRIRTRMSRVRD